MMRRLFMPRHIPVSVLLLAGSVYSSDSLGGQLPKDRVYTTVVDCGCPSTCTDLALNRYADGRRTCRDLIRDKMSANQDERLACVSVSKEYPLICGSNCDPNSCMLNAQRRTSISRNTGATELTAFDKLKDSTKQNLGKNQPPRQSKRMRKATPDEEKAKSLALLRNITEPLQSTDVPFYLHVFKSAGSTMKRVLRICYGLAIPHQTKEPPSLEVVTRRGGKESLVNVATHSPATIDVARNMGLVESNVADVIISPFLYEGARLFTPRQGGRMFSIFRNPVDRAVSLFYYLCHATWETGYDPSLCDYSLEQYGERVAAGELLGRDNWLVRSLSSTPRGPITDEDLAYAIDVVRTKFLVGLISQMDESVKRFETFFGWNPPNKKCMKGLLHDKPANQFSHKKAVEGSKEYKLIATQYEYDLKLYEVIVEIFHEQAKLFQ